MSIPFWCCEFSVQRGLARTAMRLIVMLLVPVSSAQATALGSLETISAIGQPLRVEISAAGATADGVTKCLRVVPPAASQDGIPAILNARLSVAGAGADARLVVTQSDPARDPVLRLAIQDVCDARLRREYTLLLPFASAVATPTARTATAPREPAPVVTPSGPAKSATRPAASGSMWVTAPGESVAALAQALRPDDAGARKALAARIIKLNPDLERDGLDASAPLPSGTQLRVPSLAEIASIASGSAAPRSVRTRDAGKRSPAPKAASPASPPSPPPAKADRLLVQGERDPARDPARAEAAARQSDSRVGPDAELLREERLVIAIDESIKLELELLDRIRRLEEIEQALRSQLLAELAQAPATPPNQPAATPPVSDIPEREEPLMQTPARADPGQGDWLLLMGFFLVTVAALALYERRRTTRNLLKQPIRQARPGPLPTVSERTVRAETDRGIDQIESADSGVFPHTEPHQQGSQRRDKVTAPLPIEDEELTPAMVSDELIAEHESAVELADIMVSFGRLHGAAETLSDYIRANPTQAVTPWLKLLEVYHAGNMKPEFNALARQFNKTFNVKSISWDSFDATATVVDGLESLPHVVDRLVASWGTRDCQVYLDKILRDNREGTRQGFSLMVIDDILMLVAVLEDQLGRYYREPTEHAA